MSYGITNDYYNSSYNYDIFSRKTQAQEANSNQDFQQSAKLTQSNASTNTQAWANSTEYPQASPNVLAFLQNLQGNDTNLNTSRQASTAWQTEFKGQEENKSINTAGMSEEKKAIVEAVESYFETRFDTMVTPYSSWLPENYAKYKELTANASNEEKHYLSEVFAALGDKQVITDEVLEVGKETFSKLFNEAVANYKQATTIEELNPVVLDSNKIAASQANHKEEIRKAELQLEKWLEEQQAKQENSSDNTDTINTQSITDIEETQNLAQTTETEELYMVGDERAGAGTTYDYTVGYGVVCDFDKLSQEMEKTKVLFQYMDKYGVEEGKNLFYAEFGADVISYGKNIMQEAEERFQILNTEFRNAMRDMGLMTDYKTYNNLPQDPELLAQVQARFDERISALGIEKQEMPNTEFITNHQTQEVTILNKDTGEAIDSFKFQYFNG